MHVTQFENTFLVKNSPGLEKGKFMDNKKQCLSTFSHVQALNKHQLALDTSILSFELKVIEIIPYIYLPVILNRRSACKAKDSVLQSLCNQAALKNVFALVPLFLWFDFFSS